MLGLLSDAHGNLAAFDRGLALLRRHGASEIHFLGDAIGYLPNIAVLERLHAEEIPCVMGNHEAMMLAGGLTADKEAAYRLSEIAAMLPDSWREWIATWPRQRELVVDGRRLLLLHGSPSDPTFGYVYPDTDLAPFAATPADAVFMGNTHRPFIRSAAEIQFVNIGSAGLPRDHAAWGSVCLHDPASRQTRILRYPIEDTIEALLLQYPDLHPAVLKTFARRPDGDPYGDICR